MSLTQYSAPQRALSHGVSHGGGMLESMWDWFPPPPPFVGSFQQIIEN